MADAEIFVNGVNGSTGEYLLPALRQEDLVKAARGEVIDVDLLAELEDRKQTQAAGFATLGPEPALDDLTEFGWGIVFAQADPDTAAIKAKLEPLLELRRSQTGNNVFHVFEGDTGRKPNQSKTLWAAERGVAPQNPDPKKLPYYLLLVGDPSRIDYGFQYELSVAHAVGRLHFSDLDDYRRYADGVVAAENGEVSRGKRACFFGPRNNGDKATKLSHDHLVTPLAEDFAQERADWQVEELLGDDATKKKLQDALGASAGPSLLFSASHGVGFDKDDPLQLEKQGALLCQDWKGPFQGIDPSQYLAASDVKDDARVAGLVAMHFACYGAGTPRFDGFVKKGGAPVELASQSFVARLPQRLLAHPGGAALAVVGHVDRAWGWSFMWPQAGPQRGIFTLTLGRLANGERVGHAMERFSLRWAELCAAIVQMNQQAKLGLPQPPGTEKELAGIWTASNDSRSYVVLGDPAVTLAI